jgi:polyisoprenoid-binding protein YceI
MTGATQDTLADAKLKVVIKTAALEVLDEQRDADRRELHRVMYDDVLKTKRFPEVVFDSTSISGDHSRKI